MFVRKRLLPVYLFLFIFVMFNREFMPFNFDLRFAILPFGGLILVTNLIAAIKDKVLLVILKERYFLLINIFFVLLIISNVMWLFNGLTMDRSAFIATVASALYNYLFALVVVFNIKMIEKQKVLLYARIGFGVLFVSMMLVLFHVDLRIFSGQNLGNLAYPGNLPFLPLRIAGFAQNPNYTSYLVILFFFINLVLGGVQKSITKVLLFILVYFTLLLSSSMTTIAIFFACLTLYGFAKLFKKDVFTPLLLIGTGVLVFAPAVPITFQNFNIGMYTMDLRFFMWRNAFDLFLNSPLIGSGLTSFRSHFDSVQWGWYVQAHNSFVTVLSEAGIFAFVVFCSALTKQLLVKNKFYALMVASFIGLGFTSDVISHAYFVVIGVLIYYLLKQDEVHNFSQPAVAAENIIADVVDPKPLVSIIMPVYNVEEFLEDALLSVKNQTYQNIELIAVNDGSTDASLAILEEYKQKGLIPNMVIVSQANQGLSGARNSGLPHVKGKYLYFFDSDDLLDATCIAKCVEFAELNHLDIVHFTAEIIAVTGDYAEDDFFVTNLPDKIVFTQKEAYLQNLKVPVWLYFYRSNLIISNNLQFYPGLIHEDELFTPQVLAVANKVGILNEKFFKRRLRANSIMTNVNLEMVAQKLNSINIILDQLTKMVENAYSTQKFFLEGQIIALSITKKAHESTLLKQRRLWSLTTIYLIAKRKIKKIIFNIR